MADERPEIEAIVEELYAAFRPSGVTVDNYRDVIRAILSRHLTAPSQPAGPEIARLRSIIERDRSDVARATAAMREVFRRHSWLAEGRGSYEWNDDRWHDEFMQVREGIISTMERLDAIARDLTDTPSTTAEVNAARAIPRAPSPATTQRRIMSAPSSESAGAAQQALRWGQDRLQEALTQQHHGSVVTITKAVATALLQEWVKTTPAPATMAVQPGWLPTPANVNALPEAIQKFVHDLATRCDPAGDVAALTIARDTIRALEIEREAQPAGERIEGWVDQVGDGDCWIACLASLTGIPFHEFPVPPDRHYWGDEQHEQAYTEAVKGFLRKRGWFLHRMWAVPKGYAIATGDSPRLDGFSHCVVVRDGRMVHDPHPSREGLGAKSTAEFEVLIPFIIHGAAAPARETPPSLLDIEPPPYASDLALWERWGRDLYYSRNALAVETTPWEELNETVRKGWCLAAHDYHRGPRAT